MRVPSLWSVGAAAALVAATGCEVHHQQAFVEPVGQVEITSAPVVDYAAYPHTVYRGQTVYYVNGRWGFPRGRDWAYMQSEPPELVRYRRGVEVAPPAPQNQLGPPPAVQVR
jgi:hypothetical protein